MKKKTHVAQLDSGVLAVVHRAGRSWRVLVVSVRNHRPSILKATTFPLSEGGRIESLLAEHKAGRVICVLPAASVVCRTCTLPDADPEQLEQALGLQAEAYLLGNAPPHRRAMTVLPAAAGETSRSGIITAWPEAAPCEAPPTERPVTYAPDIAALTALLGTLRPADPLLWLDRADGSVAVTITHANGAVFRATREESSAGADWLRCITRLLAETTLSVGHTGPFVESLIKNQEPAIASVPIGEASLMLPPEILADAVKRLDGTRHDATWWSEYGISAGIALAATGALAPLTAMLNAPAIHKPSLLRRASTQLSQPHRALAVILVCLVVVGLAPLAAAALRVGILKLRYPHIEQQVAAVNEVRGKLAMYDALEGQAWSMSKLLADIACNTPEGIELEVVHLAHSDSRMSVGGEAMPHGGLTAPEIISLMQERLQNTGIFNEVNVEWREPTAHGHYKFDLSGKIIVPHRRFNYDVQRDFARWTLQARREGDPPPEDGPSASDLAMREPTGASGAPSGAPASPTVSSPSSGGADPPSAASTAGDATGPEGSEGSSSRPRGGHSPIVPHGGGSDFGGEPISIGDAPELGPNPGAIPELLTAEQINLMTKQQVIDHFTEVAKANKRARKANNEELIEQLKNQQDLLIVRLRELNQ